MEVKFNSDVNQIFLPNMLDKFVKGYYCIVETKGKDLIKIC